MILIVGSQRTGSTLMSMILGAHPQLKLRGDLDLPEILNGPCAENDVVHSVAWTARHALIKQSCASPKCVFMLRNIPAIVGSMMALGSPSWAQQYSFAEIARAIIGISEWYNQHCIISYTVPIFRDNDILRAATVCAYLKSYMIVEYRKSGLATRGVRYEDLVSNPKDTVTQIARFLKINWSDNLLRHHEICDGGAFAGNDPKKRIDTASVNKWKNQLSSSQTDVILSVVRDMDAIFDGFSHNYGVCDV